MNHYTGPLRLVLGVTVMFIVSVNEPLDWCSAMSTGCDSHVYSQCE